jgi:hypothetical protein
MNAPSMRTSPLQNARDRARNQDFFAFTYPPSRANFQACWSEKSIQEYFIRWQVLSFRDGTERVIAPARDGDAKAFFSPGIPDQVKRGYGDGKRSNSSFSRPQHSGSRDLQNVHEAIYRRLCVLFGRDSLCNGLSTLEFCPLRSLTTCGGAEPGCGDLASNRGSRRVGGSLGPAHGNGGRQDC